MIKDTRYSEINKLMEESNKCRVWCKCGKGSHSFVAGKYETDKAICQNCGKYIFKNKKVEFKEKMKCMMKN